MMTMVPSVARAVPPETGASSISMPLAAIPAATRFAVAGELVDRSMNTVPGLAFSAMPPAPSVTSSTTRGMGREVITTSQRAATSATEAARGRAEIGAGFHRVGAEVEDDDLMVGVADDVAAHRATHVAHADKANLHVSFPLVSGPPGAGECDGSAAGCQGWRQRGSSARTASGVHSQTGNTSQSCAGASAAGWPRCAVRHASAAPRQHPARHTAAADARLSGAAVRAYGASVR